MFYGKYGENFLLSFQVQAKPSLYNLLLFHRIYMLIAELDQAAPRSIFH